MKSTSLRAILLMGPTASGKTAAALHLARKFPIEIISVDSALVFRGMDIGTAKPSSDEISQCPHHLIDVISPEEAYSAARFCMDAERLIREITERGHTPLLAGGTMLYYKALIEGLSDLPQANADLRQSIEMEAAAHGWPAVHAKLALIDPDAAARLNPNDAQRIQRAFEIVRITGRPLAESYARKEEPVSNIEFLPLALQPSDRSVLHTRIEQRFAAMLDAGFEQEVRQLRCTYQLEPGMTSMRCVGYRQMWDYLDQTCSSKEMYEKGVAATRQLAKRQITWLRQFRENWACYQEFDSLDPLHLEQIESAIRRWLGN